MKITLVEGMHLTASDRRDVARMIELGAMTGRTKTKTYSLVRLEPSKYSVKCCKRETDDWNRPWGQA
jgi:hypothetical protein